MKIKKNAFTIIELLVVLAVIGVFAGIAYPNISNWIKDRNVKKEVYETVTFIKERKAEVTSGKYGMIQVLLNDQLEVFTLSPEKYFQIYKSFNSPYTTHKKNYTCGFSDTAGFTIESKYSSHDFGVNATNSNVNVYPSTSHPFPKSYSVICITKDGSIKYDRSNVNEKDEATGKFVDYFLLCSKSNSTMQSCKEGAKFKHMYKITWDRFVNTKLYKYNKNKNSWIKIDG
jgi:prepilin-type N-terminal cleavage/methylation domain-containing protein